ncbi:hypothetical protein RN001_003716 [Aquatica leii]|uniref:Uncharacterized protein n=1 Tax=Aquatica leii TaxID=1421715 RepID=A0AAN7ST29_9COLE|nr:hypothetical protein RN001_003716 [Aquatica leii]
MNENRCSTPLPFRLIGMTEEELLTDLYVDIPSDTESIAAVVFESDIEEEPTAVNNEIIIDEEYESESDLTLAELIRRQPELTHQKIPTPDTTTIKWDKQQTVEDIFPFVENTGPADFIKNMNNPTPGQLFLLFLDDNLHGLSDATKETVYPGDQLQLFPDNQISPSPALDSDCFVVKTDNHPIDQKSRNLSRAKDIQLLRKIYLDEGEDECRMEEEEELNTVIN